MNTKKQYFPPTSETLKFLIEAVIAGSADPENYINPFGEQESI